MAVASLPKIKQAERLWTYDEMVAELPETNQPMELWNGEIIMAPAPQPNHQTIVLNLAVALKSFVTAKKLGKVFVSPVDVVLSQHRVVQPDVFFIAKKNLDIIGNQIRGVPDLAMEVISEGSWHRDRIDKKALYEQFNLPEYWIVDPETKTIEVFVLEKGSYKVHSRAAGGDAAKSKILQGFALSFEQIQD